MCNTEQQAWRKQMCLMCFSSACSPLVSAAQHTDGQACSLMPSKKGRNLERQKLKPRWSAPSVQAAATLGEVHTPSGGWKTETPSLTSAPWFIISHQVKGGSSLTYWIINQPVMKCSFDDEWKENADETGATSIYSSSDFCLINHPYLF